LEFVGRLDHQVKIRGYRIELGEIEAVLMEHCGVRQCVVKVWDERRRSRLVAYVVPAEEPAPSTEELRAHLQEKLPDYMLPTVFVELSELPLNSNGKLDHQALPDPIATDKMTASKEPRTAVEEIVAGIWSEVLRLKMVGVKENFFELGGHSLL